MFQILHHEFLFLSISNANVLQENKDPAHYFPIDLDDNSKKDIHPLFRCYGDRVVSNILFYFHYDHDDDC